ASMHTGIVVGVAAAFLVAVVGALNKRLIVHGEALVVTLLEFGAGALFLTAVAAAIPGGSRVVVEPSAHDALLLVVLAGGCTLFPFALWLVALRHVSAFAGQLAVNLEPVYAILLAVPLLHEQQELGALFYGGVLIVLGVVFVQPLIGRPRQPLTESSVPTV